MDDDERYISVEMSIIGSLLEVREMQAGRQPKKTWKEFLAELPSEDEQEVTTMENQENYERYIPVEMSIVGSLLEIREMRAGRQPEPTLEDFFSEVNELIEQEKANDNNPD